MTQIKDLPKKIGIYKITSPSGRIYIGQSTDILYRFKTYRNTKCIRQVRLLASFNKYGILQHSFEIIEECLPGELNVKERVYQELYEATGRKGLNCRLTKTGDKSGTASDFTKKRMSEAGKKAVRPQHVVDNLIRMNKERTTKTPEHKAKLKLFTTKDNPMNDPAVRKKVSETSKGRKLSAETKKKISDRMSTNHPMKGRQHSELSRAKMSKTHTGTKHPWTSLILKGKTGALARKSKKVQCTLTGMIYASLTIAAEAIGMKQTTLSQQLTGRNPNKTTLKYYVNQVA